MTLPRKLEQYVNNKKNTVPQIISSIPRLIGRGDEIEKEILYIVEVELFFHFLQFKTKASATKLANFIFVNYAVPMNKEKYLFAMLKINEQFKEIKIDPKWHLSLEKMAHMYAFIFGICLLKCIDLFVALLLGICNGNNIEKYDPMLQCVPAGQGCEYHIGYSKYEDEPKLYYELINYNYFDTSLLIFDDFNHKKLLDKYITENNIKKNTDKQVCLLKQYNYLH